METDYQVLQVEASAVQLDTIERANVDVQVSTAKQYPRDIKRSMNNAVAIITMDKDTASACSYTVPRGGKSVTGPSVHLAKILAQCFGNIRAEAKVVNITDKHITSRAIAWDLENNYAVAFEVQRSIASRSGGRFSDDMITLTGNAANSIAYRNAVLAIIPKAITDKAYKAAQEMITGDLSDESKLISRRSKMFENFKDAYGITESEVVKILGLNTSNQIKAEQIGILIGIWQALKDGDTNVSDLLSGIRTVSVDEKKETIKKKTVNAVELP